MHLIKNGCLILLLLLTAHVHSKELLLIAGLETPPYVIPADNSGFEIELMEDILGQLGHSITVLYVPYGRILETMQKVDADIALTLTKKHGLTEEFISQPYVTYQNVAVSKTKRAVSLNHIADLQQYSVVAYQNAYLGLGTEYANATKNSPMYLELPQQRRQVELFLADKFDLAVLDINIFNYFASSLKTDSNQNEFQVHCLFPPISYSAAFKDVKLRDFFDQTLAKYQIANKYDRLLEKYDLSDPACSLMTE